jgi:hypothetical protein
MKKSDLFYLVLLVVFLGMFIFGLVGILNGNLNPSGPTESNYKFEGNSGVLQLENGNLNTVGSNQGFDTNAVVKVAKAPASFPVANDYPLCEIALARPDWYDHLSNEEKSTRLLKGYDPRLYCPESKWPVIPEWAK